MKRIDHPHVAVDGIGGPAGTLRGHIHRSTNQGVTFQCPMLLGPTGHQHPCDHTYTATWAEIDAANADLAESPRDTVRFPPCPACGATTFFAYNDVEYGVDLPEHYTARVIREHATSRPAFAKLERFAASRIDGSHQGSDFSHLPAHQRPSHHVGPAE